MRLDGSRGSKDVLWVLGKSMCAGQTLVPIKTSTRIKDSYLMKSHTGKACMIDVLQSEDDT